MEDAEIELFGPPVADGFRLGWWSGGGGALVVVVRAGHYFVCLMCIFFLFAGSVAICCFSIIDFYQQTAPRC